MLKLLAGVVATITATQLFGKTVQDFVDAINIAFESIKLSNIKLDTGRVAVFFNIRNENKVNINLEGFTGSLFWGGRQLASIDTAGQVALPPKKKVRVKLNFKTDNEELILRVVDIIAGGSPLEPFVIEGSVRVKGQSIPIKHQINFFTTT